MSKHHTGVDPETFDEYARDPLAWFMKARALFESAAELMRHTARIDDVTSVAAMLRGFATENLLKGLWYDQHPVAPEKLGTLGLPKIGHHDLEAWADAVQVEIDVIPRAPLRVLTKSIKWHGRYPTPKSHSQHDVLDLADPDPDVVWLRGHDDAFWPYIRRVVATYTRSMDLWGEQAVQEMVDCWQGTRRGPIDSADASLDSPSFLSEHSENPENSTMPNTLRFQRVLRAPPERVYRAFLEPEAMVKWLPPHGFTGKVHHVEATVGGTYRMSFTNFSTGSSHAFGGEYLELVPGERIRHTDVFDDPHLPGTLEVTISLKAVSVGTELEIVQAGVPDVIPPEACHLGWQESLALLALLVEPEIPE